MSFIGNIRAYSPKVTRFLGSVATGNDPERRPIRISITVAVLIAIVTIVVVSTNGSLFATGLNTSTHVGLSDSVSISANPSTISQGSSLTLQPKITHSFPNAMMKVTITVTGPAGSGISGSKTITITTNSAGNGIANVAYPFSPPFAGTASTTKSGTYHVTATFMLVYPIASASTTFTVR
jgi:phosphatidate phosphatase APP1